MKREVIRLLISIINETGINLSKEHVHHNKAWRFVLIILLGLCSTASIAAYCIMHYENFEDFGHSLSYLAVAVTTFSAIFVFYRFRWLIAELLHQIDDSMYTYSDNDDYSDIEYKWYIKEENILIMMYTFLCLGMGVLVIAGTSVVVVMMFNDEVDVSLYTGWSPWSDDNRRHKIFTFLLQSVLGMPYYFLSFIFLMPMLVIVCEFLRQFAKLKIAITSIWIKNSILGDNSNERVDNITRENIIACIRHHQVLLKNFQLFKIWFSSLFTSELLMCICTLTLASVILTHTSNFNVMVHSFIIVLCCNFNLITRCFIGEIFSTLNEAIADEIFYEFPWHRASKENQKMLSIFHMILCRPLHLHGIHIFKASNRTFAKINRLTYSCFNVMNATLKKP